MDKQDRIAAVRRDLEEDLAGVRGLAVADKRFEVVAQAIDGAVNRVLQYLLTDDPEDDDLDNRQVEVPGEAPPPDHEPPAPAEEDGA